jgi:hypothetical protein
VRLLLVLAFVAVLSACGATGESAPTAEPSTSACPEDAVWHRNVDHAWDEPHASPEAAVRDAAGDEVEVHDVRTSGRSSEVDVEIAGEDGVFFVDRVASGWLVEGGAGCAVMPAEETLSLRMPCKGPDPTSPSDLEEGEGWQAICFG